MIWMDVLRYHTSYNPKIHTKDGQETLYISRLIASLKKWIKKKENEIPKYLGKK